jgi:molybdenum cofactor biosynthesis enzyme MoaA
MIISANKIPQVRVLVNTHCGKHCIYCRPSGESSCQLYDEDFELLQKVSEILLRQGHKDFRLTGGDPLLCNMDDLCAYIAFLKKNGAKEISLVTRNGVVFSHFQALRDAGLRSITFSIDSLETNKWLDYCGLPNERTHEHAELLYAAQNAQRYGFSVSINCVVLKTTSDDELERLVEFSSKCLASLKLEEMIRDIGGDAENLHRPLDSVHPETLTC